MNLDLFSQNTSFTENRCTPICADLEKDVKYTKT